LAGHDALSVQNLRYQAALAGIAEDRLVFADRIIDPAAYLGRYGAADLFLDTYPYSAHATAADALWAGLPILTRIGDTFQSRVAASLLMAAGLSDLVVNNTEDYVSRAVALSQVNSPLMGMRQSLRNGRRTLPVFDMDRLTADLERAIIDIVGNLQLPICS